MASPQISTPCYRPIDNQAARIKKSQYIRILLSCKRDLHGPVFWVRLVMSISLQSFPGQPEKIHSDRIYSFQGQQSIPLNKWWRSYNIVTSLESRSTRRQDWGEFTIPYQTRPDQSQIVRAYQIEVQLQSENVSSFPTNFDISSRVETNQRCNRLIKALSWRIYTSRKTQKYLWCFRFLFHFLPILFFLSPNFLLIRASFHIAWSRLLFVLANVFGFFLLIAVCLRNTEN